MVSAATARNIVGALGNVFSFFLFVSPVPTFIKICKKKSVEQFKPDPYLATVLNCSLWIFYGLPIVHPDSTLVITINTFGLAVELTYLAIYFTFADKRRRIKVIYVMLIECAFLAVVVACTLLLCHTHKKRSLVVGVLCIVFVVMMYASPLTIMRKVIRTKSVKYMPFTLSFANFLNGCAWVAYSLIKLDLFILIGNSLGLFCAVLQLILYACYFRSTPQDDLVSREVQVTSDNRPSPPAV